MGAVKVILPVRLLPDTVKLCAVEAVLTTTLPKLVMLVVEACMAGGIVSAIPVPLNDTFFVVAPLLVIDIDPVLEPVLVGLKRTYTVEVDTVPPDGV